MRRHRRIDHLETHASLLHRASVSDPEARRRALGEIIECYSDALVEYAGSVWRLQAEDARDVVQQFLLDKMVGGRLLGAYDPKKGRFRGLLLRSLHHFVTDRHRRAGRGTVPADEESLARASGGVDPAKAFDQSWARTVIRESLQRSEATWARDDPRAWRLFDARVVAPIFDGSAPPSYLELVAELRFKSPAEAMNLLTTAKRRYIACLRETVRGYAGRGVDLETEVAELVAALERA